MSKRRRKKLALSRQRKRQVEYPGVKFDPRIDSLTVPELIVEAVKYVDDFPDAPMAYGLKSLAIRVSQIDKNDQLGFAHVPVEDAVEMLRCFLSIAQDNPTCAIQFASFGATEQEDACDHEWVVFSTAINDGCLMVQCVNCGGHGSVDDPTEDEWSKAFYAPSQPYRWMDDERVNPRGVLPSDKWYVSKNAGEASRDNQSQEGADQ